MFWPLVIKHAVSGINYECLVTLLQHKESFYDTDLFTKMFEAIRKVCLPYLVAVYFSAHTHMIVGYSFQLFCNAHCK
jgi:alanyl-tRNA synthetase